MKKINKIGIIPDITTDWINKNNPKNWADFSDQKEDNKTVKTALRDSLFDEQNGICCYCCLCLSEGDYHIEHIKSRDNHPKLTFDYKNLLISCNGNNSKYCGHKKGSKELVVTPFMDECDTDLWMNLAGELETKNESVRSSIEDVLNLNDKRLCDIRSAKMDLICFTFDPSQVHSPPLKIADMDILNLIIQSLQGAEYHEMKYLLDKLT